MDYRTVWLKTDSQRRRFLPFGVRAMSSALRKAIQPAVDQIERYSRESDLVSGIGGHIRREEIQKGYLDLYKRVSPFFAERSYQDIKGRLKSDMKDEWLRRIENYVMTGGVIQDRVTSVTETTAKRLSSIVSKGIDQGLSIPEIAKQIDTLGLDEIIRNRSTVIARTEVINASNFGSIEGARGTGLDLVKIWLPTMDGRTRDDHADMADHPPVDIDGSFDVGGESADYPGDPSLSAEQCINCRCSIVYEVRE